jgi:hypothetical protein
MEVVDNTKDDANMGTIFKSYCTLLYIILYALGLYGFSQRVLYNAASSFELWHNFVKLSKTIFRIFGRLYGIRQRTVRLKTIVREALPTGSRD